MFQSLGQSYLCFIVFLAVGFWSVGRLLKKHDPEGKVKGAAKEGLVRGISRWLK